MRATIESDHINRTCGVMNLTNIEVCEDNGWREICDADFTNSDAEVICRQLNYSGIGKFLINNSYLVCLQDSGC